MTRRRDDPNQTLFAWGQPQAVAAPPRSEAARPAESVSGPPPRALVQRLPWDFATTFPPPTEDAIDAGVVDETDTLPENLKGLHESYSRQCLATLGQLDAVLDAKRRQVDPRTGKAPKTHAARERLRTYLEKEPNRLEHAWRVLIETYENAFGPEAAQAFAKCLRARHAGIPVEAESSREPEPTQPLKRRQAPTVLPVPTPLAEAVKAKHFGEDERGRPIRPSRDEVRAITQNHAERLTDTLNAIRELDRWLASPACNDQARLESERHRSRVRLNELRELYAGSFGPEAAERLEAYARRQVVIQASDGPARRR